MHETEWYKKSYWPVVSDTFHTQDRSQTFCEVTRTAAKRRFQQTSQWFALWSMFVKWEFTSKGFIFHDNTFGGLRIFQFIMEVALVILVSYELFAPTFLTWISKKQIKVSPHSTILAGCFCPFFLVAAWVKPPSPARQIQTADGQLASVTRGMGDVVGETQGSPCAAAQQG